MMRSNMPRDDGDAQQRAYESVTSRCVRLLGAPDKTRVDTRYMRLQVAGSAPLCFFH